MIAATTHDRRNPTASPAFSFQCLRRRIQAKGICHFLVGEVARRRSASTGAHDLDRPRGGGVTLGRVDELKPGLRDRFLDARRIQAQPASQVLREFMRAFIASGDSHKRGRPLPVGSDPE